MSDSTDEDLAGCFRGFVVHGLPKTKQLWPLLWDNHHLFDAQNAVVCPLNDGCESEPYAFRTQVVAVIWHALGCHYRLHGYVFIHRSTAANFLISYLFFRLRPETPAPWSSGIDEILLYCLQHVKQDDPIHNFTTPLLSHHLSHDSAHKCSRIISKVIVNPQVAVRLAKVLCRNLERATLVDWQLRNFLLLPQVLVRNNDLLARAVINETNLFRAVASCCQQQLCTGKDTQAHMCIIEEGFRTIR